MRKIFLAAFILSGSIINAATFKLDEKYGEVLIKDATFIVKAYRQNDSPTLKNRSQDGRTFIAKVNSFGLYRYYVLQNDDDVKVLLLAVEYGHGSCVEFYYTDEEVFIVK